MNTSGDAAESIVRMGLQGFDVAARITGSGAKEVAILIYTILKDKNAKLEQNCKGVGIFATKNSQIFLYKGEISNNLAINSGKIFLKNPQNEKKNKIALINSCICGSAIFSGNNTYFQMEKDFIIKNNYCQLNTEINIDKNNIVNDLENGIKGGQLFFSKSIVRIKGGLIENGKNISKQKKNKETNKIKKIVDFNEGGGIIFINCHKIEIIMVFMCVYKLL